MIYQLPSGKCIEISIDHYLSLTDDEINAYIAADAGIGTENPFRISPIKTTGKKDKPTSSIPIEDDEENEKYKPLGDHTFYEKFNDRDYHNKDDE